ncbi:MAG TPA: LD-carboxypeptidase [Holophaga sp.]|nr:LD-carboxypeptidase [Holophaga sp.]
MSMKPRALRAGDTLGLIDPSGSVKDLGMVDRAADMLRGHGFQVKLGASCRSVYGYLAGKDSQRAADVNAFFADPSVAGIVCLKGGYGTPRILDALDYGLIRRNPKVFVGYSDITGIHLALGRQCSLPTFHGPMGISDTLLQGEESSVRSWLGALTTSAPLGRLENPPGSASRRTLVGGLARGPVIGGNLSLVAATLGTPYEIDARGKILFFEDVDEEPYRIDRMLTQLRLAGKFGQCAGILLGDWNHCVAEEADRSLELQEVFQDLLVPAGKPLMAGFQAGHCSPTLTLPFGVEAVMDADSLTLDIVESALSD